MIAVLFRLFFKIFFRTRIYGNLPPSQRMLIVANHESFLDGMLLAAFLPGKPVFVVHSWVKRYPWFKPFLAMVDHLAVDPTHPLAMKSILKLARSGRPVVIFPEGRLSTTGSLMKVYEGPAFIAAKSAADVVPVRLMGTGLSRFTRLKEPHPRKWFPKFSIHVGDPVQISIDENLKSKDRRRLAGLELQKILQQSAFDHRPDLSLAESLLLSIELYGKKHVIADDVKKQDWTYGNLLKAVVALGLLLEKKTFKSEKVGVLLPNLVASLGVFYGLSARGRIPAMLNYTAGQAGLEAALSVAQIRTVVSSRAFAEVAKLTEALEALALQGVQIVWLEDLQKEITLMQKLQILWNLTLPRGFVLKQDPSTEAVILFTSGSEGVPKGVVHSHRSLIANVYQVKAVFPFGPQDYFLNALPIFHAFGLTAGALLPTLTGTRVFLYPSPLHYRVIPELIYDRGCTVLFGTSTFLGNYAKNAHPYDFCSLRFVVAGAEKLSEPVRELWSEKFGIRILEGYGATETAPVLSVNSVFHYSKGSVGPFLPRLDYVLEKIEGVEKGGLLHVRGPNVMMGYLLNSNPGVLQKVESSQGPGWYNTGDIVDVDQGGFVRILGRVKRFAKVAGEMVSLETVENLAYKCRPEAQFAAVAKKDEKRGESLVLFSTVQDLSRSELADQAKAHGYPELAVAREIRFVEKLPILGTGKLDYKTIQTWVE